MGESAGFSTNPCIIYYCNDFNSAYISDEQIENSKIDLNTDFNYCPTHIAKEHTLPKINLDFLNIQQYIMSKKLLIIYEDQQTK